MITILSEEFKIQGFALTICDGKVKIHNNTKMTLMIASKPIPPKRKYVDFLRVAACSYLIFDLREDEAMLDLSSMCFYFVE